MSNQYSRMPLHIQERLYKALTTTDAEAGEQPESAGIAPGASAYNSPMTRVSGNKLFRRFLDGTLDIEAAKNTVLETLTQAKNLSPLTDLEKLVLNICFPGAFPFYDATTAARMSAVHLAITAEERMQICAEVAAHLREVLNRNAGYGGGSVPGRSETVV